MFENSSDLNNSIFIFNKIGIHDTEIDYDLYSFDLQIKKLILLSLLNGIEILIIQNLHW